MAKIRYTVLGGRGFIGARLVTHLMELDYDVWVPTRNDLKIFTEDLGRVFYCIGLTANFRQNPMQTVEAHVCLLNKLMSKGIFDSLLYLSSTRVYQGANSTDENATLVVTPSSLDNLYNLTKLMGESICLNSGRPVKVVRLSNVYGAVSTSLSFLSQVLNEAITGEVVIRSDPASEKDYISVEDAVRILARIERNGQKLVYNLASGQNIRHAEIADVLSRLGCRVHFKAGSSKQIFPRINIRRLCEEIEPPINNVLNDLPKLYKAINERNFYECYKKKLFV